MMIGRGPLGHQSLQIDFSVDVIQSQLNELRPFTHQVTMLGNHVPMPAAANRNANHKMLAQIEEQENDHNE